MTRKKAIEVENQLKARGVYKPYVTEENKIFLFESYPLTARVGGVFDIENGPMMNITVTDCTLPRIDKDATIATINLYLGQDTVQHVAALLVKFHAESHARSKEQEKTK